MQTFDTIIIGAGAAGLMCGMTAGKRKRRVLILDHANKAGKKIIMSGGGRCNFTNLHISPTRYLSNNPHFCKSALNRYTQWDFIELVKKHQIPFHEKTLGQLFCDNKSQDIVNLLLSECEKERVEIRLHSTIESIERLNDHHFKIQCNGGYLQCHSLVIACGGLSIPTMGATPFGYKIAEQFGIKVWPTRAGLVPLTLQPEDKDRLSTLSGISVNSLVSSERRRFLENILFTHRGLSGPAILQISSYWQTGEVLTINMMPDISLADLLSLAKKEQPHKLLKNIISEILPKRLTEAFLPPALMQKPLQSISFQEIDQIVNKITQWKLKPNGTQGYRTAEVTLGGVDCNAISSKTMEATHIPGLYFIGEVLDVSGWLGGYNFQWAWASGWAAGQAV
jgi:predicted Rossmann fold flavoprotein